MKRAILILLVVFTLGVKAQHTSVEKSITGIQTGPLGLWFFNEYKLTDKIVLRSEFGLEAGITIRSDGRWHFGLETGVAFKESGIYYIPKTVFAMGPSFILEPRRYYNIDRRAKKGKNTKNNSANFFAITARYSPDWFVIFNTDNVYIPNQIFIAPKWGIKRNLGNHFNYELGIGLGVRSYFGKKLSSEGYSKDAAADLHLRIGYAF